MHRKMESSPYGTVLQYALPDDGTLPKGWQMWVPPTGRHDWSQPDDNPYQPELKAHANMCMIVKVTGDES